MASSTRLTRLAIDLGATSLRVCAGGPDEAVRVLFRRPTPKIEHGGLLCWDLPAILESLTEGLAAAVADLGEAPASIGCTSWAQDFVLLDEAGTPLLPPVSYREPALQGMAAAMAQQWPEAIWLPLGDISSATRLWLVQKRFPELLARAHHLLFMADFINFWLTGRCTVNWSLAAMSGLLDTSTGEWSTDLMAAIGDGLAPSELPIAQALAGPVNSPQVPALLQGVPVISGICHDTASAAAAVELRPGEAQFCLGTWAMMLTAEPHGSSSPLPLLPGKELHCVGLPGSWLLEQCIAKWRKKDLFKGWEELARATDESTCTARFNPSHPSLTMETDDMPAAIAALCPVSTPRTPGDFARAITSSLTEVYADALRRANCRSAVLVGGGIQNRTLINALESRFPIRLGPQEATAFGCILMQSLALHPFG